MPFESKFLPSWQDPTNPPRSDHSSHHVDRAHPPPPSLSCSSGNAVRKSPLPPEPVVPELRLRLESAQGSRPWRRDQALFRRLLPKAGGFPPRVSFFTMSLLSFILEHRRTKKSLSRVICLTCIAAHRPFCPEVPYPTLRPLRWALRDAFADKHRSACVDAGLVAVGSRRVVVPLS